MVSLLSLALFSLCIQRHIVSSQPDPPYDTRFTDISADGNSVTLQCKDKFSTDVPGASFYRNGQNITNSSCLTATPTGSSSELRIELKSQECDGFFSCGRDGIFSVSKEFYACPVKNVTEDTTEEIEEGSSVLLTCNFFPSPIKNYTTTWFIGIGSNARQIQNSTTEHLQSYLLQKPDQYNKYYCKIWIQSPTDLRCSPSDISSIIMVQLKKKYEMPTITEDLNYTMNNNGEGVFSVTSCGTNLTHKWYKDDGLINSTGDGIVEISDTSLRVKEINGSLRIAYVVSNVDYDNAPHSMRQTFGVYSRVSESCTTPCGVTEDTMETIIKVVIPVMGIIILFLCLILCFCGICAIHLWKRNERLMSMTRKDNSQELTQWKKIIEQLGHNTISLMVEQCSTNRDIFKLLKNVLNEATNKETCSSECSKILGKIYADILRIMEEEPCAKDTSEKESSSMPLCGNDADQNIFVECQEIKEILEKIVPVEELA